MTNLPSRVLLLLLLLSFTTANSYAQKRKPAKRITHSKITNPAEDPEPTNTNDLIKNGIKFKSVGFKVTEAYLVFDDQNPVPETNKVSLNQNVNMVLIIDTGWNEIDGKVYPGSKQVIKLNTGAEILNTEELFAAFDETGVSAADARYITLNTVITELKDRKKHIIVNFRVWDKKGSSELTGSYKLFIK